jgi:hypothetical protein
VGEILLVVIGILIAFQVDNWNEERKNNQIQGKYLEEIRDELEFTGGMMKNLVLDRYDRKMRGLNLAKAFAMNRYEIKDTLEFLGEVSYGAVFAGYGIDFISSNVYDELKNTGNLQLISNDSLKTRIVDYYQQLANYTKTAKYFITDYNHFVNGLRVYNKSDPNSILPEDFTFIVKKLKSEEVVLLANQEMNYGNYIHELVSKFYESNRELLALIRKETDGIQ